MRIINLAFLPFALGGCTLGNFASIHRSVDMTNGATQIVDAEQRLIISYPQQVTEHFEEVDGKLRKRRSMSSRMLCAEPSPDTFSVIAASGEFRVDTQKVGVGGSGALSETGASLIDRTTALQALRDNYFRLCEAYANGAIGQTDLMVGQRHNQTSLVGLIAIESLTSAGRMPAVVIGGEAEAMSANAIGVISQQLQRAQERKQDIETKLTAATTQLNGRKNELEGIKKLTGAEAEAKKARKEELEKLIPDDQKSVDGLSEQKKSAEQAIASLQAALDNSTSGSSAGSTVPTTITVSSSSRDMMAIARAVENIVKEINGNDFGPTICAHRLQSFDTHPDLRSACNNVMDVYAKRLSANEDMRIFKAAALKAQVESIMASKSLTSEQKRIQIFDLQKANEASEPDMPIFNVAD